MNPVSTSRSKLSEDVKLELECDIEEDVEAELEDFVRLSHTGRFKDAHELYDECLSRYDTWYPVAAEYADCLLREGDFQQLIAFCQKAAPYFKDPKELMLLDLMRLVGSIGIGGLFFKDAMERLQYWWRAFPLKPPFTSLRDTDVSHRENNRHLCKTWLTLRKIHLLEVFLQFLVYIGRHPVDLDASRREEPHKWRDIPDLTHDGPWSVFKDWFYHLLHHQCFWEAQRILSSLFDVRVLPWHQCESMAQVYIGTAVSIDIDSESVEIAVSALVQRFLYVVESGNPNPLAVVEWNDGVTWALFGITLIQPGEASASLLSRICLRQLLPEKLKLQISLPLNGADRWDEINNSRFEHVIRLHKYAQAVKQPMNAESLDHTEDELGNTGDELNSWALMQAVQDHSGNMLLFLLPGTVNARDGYQRTPLHWASLNGQSEAVKILLNERNTDVGRLDWFGCTPLHYAVKSLLLGRQMEYARIVEALLKFDSAKVNMKYPSGLTLLGMAIRIRFYDVAEILLRYNVNVERSDYTALPQDVQSRNRWQRLLMKYDHAQPYLESSENSSSAASSSAKFTSPPSSLSSDMGFVPDVMAKKHQQKQIKRLVYRSRENTSW